MPEPREFIISRKWFVLFLALYAGCTNLPKIEHKDYGFPDRQAFIDDGPKGVQIEVIGRVKARADWPSLDPDREESGLCINYYNKAVRDLVKFAKEKKADYVIKIRSITVLYDGRIEVHKTPECSDDGGEGQVLVEGVAVRMKPLQTKIQEGMPISESNH